MTPASGSGSRWHDAVIASASAPSVLREYALLADGERGAVIGPRGDIVWMCAPRWDSPSVFAALIGGRSQYSVTPTGPHVWGGYYEGASMIWRSRWTTNNARIECREALAFPADEHRTVVLRRVCADGGNEGVTVVLCPGGDYETRMMTHIRLTDGVWLGRVGGLYLRWSGADVARAEVDNGALTLDIDLRPGQAHDLVLEVSEHPLDDEPVDPDRAWTATEAAWRETMPALDDVLSPSDARRSYAVLRGLTSRSGGMVAAATTSLPERAEAGRNYDYRYVWIRDQCYAGHAAAVAGCPQLLADATRFVSERLLEHGDQLAPAYTTTGDPVPSIRHLSLPGYPGGFDIVGNHVNKQFQLDAFGESLVLFAAAAEREMLDAQGWRAAEAAAGAIEKRWTEPDAGIWEIEPRAWTHSRLSAAAGLRSMAGVRSGEQSSRWLTLADAIVADTSANALHPSGRWQRAPDDVGNDAALLLPPLRGALTADDPRTKATLAAYLRELTSDGYAYRFRHDDRPLADAEGAFLLCGFLVALSLHQQGRDVSARAWYERTQAACGPAQLFSEEYDIEEHQMRGNLPQAFVHALMLETSARLAAGPDEEADWT